MSYDKNDPTHEESKRIVNMEKSTVGRSFLYKD